MKKNVYIAIIIIGAVLIIAGWLLSNDSFWQTDVNKTNNVDDANIPSETIEKEVTLVIDNGEEEPSILKINYVEGMTAFDLLEKGTIESALTLKTKEYDIGIFIEAIGEKENGQDEKYWLYYVNGQSPTVAADKQEIKAGDKVEFKFEKSPF